MNTLSSTQVQERLGISRPTLYLWVRRGKLKARRVGRGLLFDEDEIMQLLGRGVRVEVWIRRGLLEDAKRDVGRGMRSGIHPSYYLEYLEPPQLEHMRMKVAASGAGREVRDPAPGGVEFEEWLEALKRGDWVFVSHEESVWRLADVRAEVSASGEAYLALDLARAGAGNDRDRRLRAVIEHMESGPLRGKLRPWRREDLYDRDAR